MIVQFVIHIIGNGGFAFDLKTSGRATRHARAQFFRSVITSFWYRKCFFHTLCESYCFTPPLKDKPAIPGLLFQVPLSV